MQKEKLINFQIAYELLTERFKSLSCYECPKLSIVKFIKDKYNVITEGNYEFISTDVFKNVSRDLEKLYNEV